jgi:hypothetical protein
MIGRMRAAQSDVGSPADALAAKGSSAGGAVALLGAIFACEIGATLLFVFARRPLLALVEVVAGMAIALRWVRAHRRLADAAVGSQIAAAREALAVGNRTTAWNIACAAAEAAADRCKRNAALAVMIDVAVDEKDLRTARMLLARIGPAREVDPLLEARIEMAEGGPEMAIRALERGRRRPSFGGAAARRLVELCAERDDLSRAVEVALDCIDLLPEEDLRNMIASLDAWGAPDHAATVAVALALRTPFAPQKIALGRATDPLRD